MDIPVYKIQMVREGTISYQTTHVYHPRDAVAIFREHVGPVDREYLVVMLLNTKHRINGVNTVSIGHLNASLMAPREVFTPAVLGKAHTIVLAHNHPSGDPDPSQQDKDVTSQLVLAGEALDIRVLDHVIIGHEDQFFSFRDNRLL